MTNIEKLKNIIEDIDELERLKVSSSSPKFIAWQTKTLRFLRDEYGEDSLEYKDFYEKDFTLTFYPLDTPESEFIKACQTDLKTVKLIFRDYLKDMETEVDTYKPGNQTSNLNSKIFIVHGHDKGLQQEVARVLEKQGLQPIILNEQTNQGRTIIEKIEHNSDVQAAVCLFTSDDEGKSKKETEYNNRARQNVVFETGYFLGKLGRDRLVIIAETSLELPSDMQGVVYTNGNWEFELLKELKAMGYTIDLNKLI